jgi:TRAP transporter TAXI family solute receptor
MKVVLIFMTVALLTLWTAAVALPNPLNEPVHLKAITPPATTATYPGAVFIAETIKKGLPSGSTIQTLPVPGGIALVGEGKADIVITFSVFSQWAAIKGDPRFGFKEAYPGIRGIAQMSDKEEMQAMQFLVTKDTGLTSLNDIKAKKYPLRLATSLYGSIAEVATKVILSYYGITYDDIRSWGGRVEHIGWREAVDAAKEGRINAMSLIAQYPYSFFMELSVKKPITLFPLSDEVIVRMEKDFPGLKKHTIEASYVREYRGVEKDINTVACGLMSTVRPGFPDELAYIVTKIIVENHKAIAQQLKAYKYFTPEIAVKHFTGFPMHPMAERYYKEIGVLK